MDAELKSRWISALKSGEYVKGKGRLHKKGMSGQPDTFCCLGVLCEIESVPSSERAEPFQKSVVDKRIFFIYKFSEGSSATVVKGSLFDKVGDEHMTQLISINDNNNSFAPVIEYIEKNL